MPRLLPLNRIVVETVSVSVLCESSFLDSAAIWGPHVKSICVALETAADRGQVSDGSLDMQSEVRSSPKL